MKLLVCIVVVGSTRCGEQLGDKQCSHNNFPACEHLYTENTQQYKVLGTRTQPLNTESPDNRQLQASGILKPFKMGKFDGKFVMESHQNLTPCMLALGNNKYCLKPSKCNLNSRVQTERNKAENMNELVVHIFLFIRKNLTLIESQPGKK